MKQNRVRIVAHVPSRSSHKPAHGARKCGASSAGGLWELTGESQRGRNALVEAVERSSNTPNGGDHSEGNGRDDQGVFDQILTFCLFPKTNQQCFHHFSSGAFD